MIKAEFQKYGSYTTDSLYQWDLNQELQFVNTDISVAPVIHFCNRKSKESLLVQSTLTEGIITCPVPNVLLQEPFDIIAYIVSMEAQKATTLFKMLIPVNRRLKPSDYEYTDNIPILTYEAIKADIQHFFNLSKAEIAVERERINKIIVPETTFKNIAIRKFESKINDGSYIDETSRRVFGMSWVEQVNPMYDPNSYIFKNPFLLYAFGRGYDPNTGSWDDYVQITGDVRLKSNRLEVGVNFIDSDKIYTKAEMYAVVAYDNTVDNTELEDIRVGIDGKIHGSAGDAVRRQIGKLNEDLGEKGTTLADIQKKMSDSNSNDGFLLCDLNGNIVGHIASFEVWNSEPYNKKYGWGGHPHGKGKLPPYSKIAGVLEADLLSVCGGKGRWNKDDTGNFQHGGHLFEGWNAEEDARLTFGIGTKNKDISWIQTFHPATQEGTDNGAYYGVTKVGSDINKQGMNFMPSITQSKSLFSLKVGNNLVPNSEHIQKLVETGELVDWEYNKTDMIQYGTMYFDYNKDKVKVYTRTGGWKYLKFEEEV